MIRRLADAFWAWAARHRDDVVTRAAEHVAREHDREDHR